LITRAQAGRGKYDEALDALESAYAISQETHNPFGLAQYSNTRAWLVSELGDWQTAYELDCAGMQLARVAPSRPPEISTLINLVLDCTALGKLDEANAYCNQVKQWMGRREFGFHAWRWQTRFADALARVHLAAGEIAQAQEQIEMLFRLTRRTQAAKYRARGLMLQARVHLARNETVAAQAFCLSARDLADALNYFPTRIESRRLLEQLGFETESVAPLVDELDQCLKHPELRRSFERGIARKIS
jgi:tetratricopeptide (TPR) repeat protein